MAQKTAEPLSLAARRMQDEAEVVLEQMFGYFTREEAPRVIAESPRRAA